MRLVPRAFVVAAILLGAIVSSCGSDDAGPVGTEVSSGTAVDGEVTVFAAASLTGAFAEIGDAFMAEYPGVDVVLSFAGSSDLAAQISEGAPADVFASADLNNMTKVTDAGLTAGDPVVFATNVAEIIVGAGNPEGVTGVDDLADPTELIVVQCAPEVPCGKYAGQIYANARITVTPASFEENVRAVVTKVVLGEADAGIVYATDVDAAGDDAEGVEIPADVNVVAEYPIVSLTGGANTAGGEAFIDFVVGEPGQQILASYGFLAP